MMAKASLNTNILFELKEIMEDEFSDFVCVYLEDSQIQIDSIEKAIDILASEEIKKHAHALKGISSNIGAYKLAELCKKVEIKALEENFKELPKLLKKIFKQYMQVKKELQKII